MKSEQRKKDLKLLFKVLITTLLCGFGLIYQSSQLISQYMTGNTLVQVTIGRKLNSSLPGITICYPVLLDMQLLSELDPGIEEKHQSYKELMTEYLDAYSKDEKESGALAASLKDVYESIQGDFPSIMATNSVQNLLDNLSLPLRNGGSDEQTKRPITITEEGYIERDGSFYRPISFPSKTVEDAISSFKIIGGRNDKMHKCFTLFSHLKKSWRNYKMVLFKLEIILQDFIYWLSPSTFMDVNARKFLFSIHSANDMPKFTIDEAWLELKSGQDYQVSFNELSIRSLGRGFDTNCIEYDLDYELGNFNTRSDCVFKCYQDKMKSSFKQNVYFFSEFLLRREHFMHGKSIFNSFSHSSITENITNLWASDKFKIDCLSECQVNCHSSIYPFDVQESDLDPARFSRGKGYIRINLRHNGLPDIFVTHLPETTFIAFVCNFGGLLGMWLGLSVWAVFDDITKRFTHFVYKISESPEKAEFKIKSKALAQKWQANRM